MCRACLHFFFIGRQSVRELRITRILKDAVFQGRNVLGPNEVQDVEFILTPAAPLIRTDHILITARQWGVISIINLADVAREIEEAVSQ